MSDYTRQRAVQKEAVLEVLTESLKDSEHQKTKQELQELAFALENEAFLCSNSEINKDYRGKLNGIKVKLKGEKGNFLRGVLLDGIFTAKDFMMLDINSVNDDKIELLLKSNGVTFDRNKYKSHKSPQKIPLPKTNVKLNQGQEIHSVLQEQLLAEANQQNHFEEIQEHQQQNEIHNDNKIESNILNINHIDDNKQQAELMNEQQQGTQKEDLESELQKKIEVNQSEEEQQNIPNILENQNQVEGQNQNQEEIIKFNVSKSDEEIIDQEQINQEVKEQTINKDIEKNNYGDQDPDVDLSQHRICEHLLTNMESNKLSSFPTQINEQTIDIQSIKLKNRELEILVNFLKEELNKQQKYNEQLMANQKQIYLAEIDQLKQQLQLAKTTYKISTEQVEISKSFQDRQNILKSLFSECQQQIIVSNIPNKEHVNQEIQSQNITLPQEQNSVQSIPFSQILDEQPQTILQMPQVQQTTQERSNVQQKNAQRVRRNQDQPKTVPGSLFD